MFLIKNKEIWSIHQIDNQILIVSIPFLVDRIEKLSGDIENHTYLISMRWEILRQCSLKTIE